MKRQARTFLIRCGICLILGTVLLLLLLRNNGYSNELPADERYRILCDAFTVPGLLMIMTGCLAAASNADALQGLVYTLKHLLTRMIPFLGIREETYYDYLQRRKEKGRFKGYFFLFAVGGVFMAAALVFFALFYSVA